MTRNQLQYHANLETQRSNLAKEELQRQQNVETNRSNLARESETHRSNRASEAETNRHNVATEVETRRSNLRNEDLTETKNKHAAIAGYINAGGNIMRGVGSILTKGATEVIAPSTPYYSDGSTQLSFADGEF